MSLLDYIKGNRKGKDAHRLEKEAMKDPFLAEALDGFDMVDDDHMARIAAIQNKLTSKKHEKTNHRSIWTSAAAVAVALLTFVGISHYFAETTDTGLHAQVITIPPIDIYIPEAVYTENIAVIATKNTELTKNISVQFSSFKHELDTEDQYEALGQELAAMENGSSSITNGTEPSPEDNLDPIQVYLPKGINTPQKRVGLNAEPLIGLDEYNIYLKQNMRRPTVWPCVGKRGKVLIEFSVDEKGVPYDLVVEYGFCGASDDEAIRLIKEGPKWTPSNRRAKVRVEF